MNDTVLWLLYVVGAAIAFCVIIRFRWRIVPAMLVGTSLTAFGWAIVYAGTAEDKRPAFWRTDLSLNLSLALIFAGAGAAAAYAVLQFRRERP